MNIYELRTEDGYCNRFRAADAETATRKALALMADAEFDLSEGTVWYHGDLYEIVSNEEGEEAAEQVRRLTYTFEPPEPACAPGHEHDWCAPHSVLGGVRGNPGVWGRGGGVIIRDVCSRCGGYREINTWAQDPSTGEEGLRSVRYEAPDDVSLAWVTSLRNDKHE